MFEFGKKGAPDQDRPAWDESRPESATAPAEAPKSRGASASTVRREAAIIGPSIHIDGDLRGEEDLVIEGEVNGTVHLKNHSLTIGAQGKIRADVYANVVYVDGSIEGDLYGSDRVVIRKSAQVKGNITSPRVVLEDGARFKGAIEMDQQAVDAALGARRAEPRAKPATPAPTQRPGSAGAGTASSTGTGDALPGVTAKGAPTA